MVYLESFKFLSEDDEWDVFWPDRLLPRIFNNIYPFRLLDKRELGNIEFNTITIFYGGNGSGKSTILNIIAQAIHAEMKMFNKETLFQRYVERCTFEMTKRPAEKKLVSSNDIFEYVNDLKNINRQVDKKKEELYQEYQDLRVREAPRHQNALDVENYEQLRKNNSAKKNTVSKFIREELGKNNITEQSNGESALSYFAEKLKENAIYLLDEPENSLSAQSQLKLLRYIENQARFYNCQFIIATHSPFLLALHPSDTIIYDIDSVPVKSRKWTDLENVRTYQQFFKEHEDKF
jgi:predicted ATPase